MTKCAARKGAGGAGKATGKISPFSGRLDLCSSMIVLFIMSLKVCRLIVDNKYNVINKLRDIMTNIQVRFGQKIREIRKQKGFSQEVLATKSKLHRTYISDIERGDRNVSLKNVEKIAKALGVSAHDLLKD